MPMPDKKGRERTTHRFFSPSGISSSNFSSRHCSETDQACLYVSDLSFPGCPLGAFVFVAGTSASAPPPSSSSDSCSMTGCLGLPRGCGYDWALCVGFRTLLGVLDGGGDAVVVLELSDTPAPRPSAAASFIVISTSGLSSSTSRLIYTPTSCPCRAFPIGA